MSDKSEEFETVGDGPDNESLKKGDSDENIFRTTNKISALDIAWNFNDPSADAALTEYKKRHLTYNDLSSLEEKDLEVLGVEDASLRGKMLQDFRNLPNQEPTFDEILKETDMREYSSTVLSNVSEHIHNLQISLKAAQVKFKVHPLEDVIMFDEKVHGSDMVLKTIEKMMDQCEEMHVLVDGILESHLMTKHKSQGICKNIMKSMFWIGAFVLTTYAGQKIIRAKLK